MRVELVIGDDTPDEQAVRHEASVPYSGCDYVTVDVACPSCKGEAPTKLRGRGYYHSHCTHHATAVAMCCGVAIGKLEAHASTVFGIAEDREMLSGKYGRVY